MDEEKQEERIHSANTENVRPSLNKKDLILSLVAVLLCGCVLSGAIPPAFIALASLAMFVYIVIAVRNAGAVVQLTLVGILATVFAFVPVSGAAAWAPVLGAGALALMIGTGTLAWLFMVLPKYKWAPIGLLVLAYGLGLLVTSDFVTPLLALAFLPAAALMAWAHARDVGRTGTILHAFLGFVITALATLCIVLWRVYDTVNYDVLMEFVNKLKQFFVDIGAETGRILLGSVELSASQAALPDESLKQFYEMHAQVFNESTLRLFADTIVGLVPALVGVPLLVMSYLSNVVLLRKYYNTEWRSYMTPNACALTISPAAALIYFVCLLIVMFVSKQSVFLMAVTNMCLLLLPGLAFFGVNAIWQNARRSKSWKGVVSILFFAALVCCMGASSLYFVALWGAYVIISDALHQKILQKMKDQNEK